MTEETETEDMIKRKGLEAPRVTPYQVDELMSKVQYSFALVPNTTTTVCTAILWFTPEDSFTLAVEYSACASPENFDVEIGEKIAKDNAEQASRSLLWLLEGYALKKDLIGDKHD